MKTPGTGSLRVQGTLAPGGDGEGRTAIRVRGLRKRYGDVEAVRGIDLTVRTGEIFAFLGPNGAGKTTTVEMLEGYRHRDAGEVEVLGADPARPGALATVRGQVACASTTGRVRSVSLIPADPPACPEAVTAIGEADWVVLGPGSWFTSVIPHLLVPDLARALITTPARRIVALNLAPQPGETEGFSPQTHLEVLADHAPHLRVDVVLADRGAAGGTAAELDKAAGRLGGRLVLADLAMRDGTPRHDPRQLAGAFAEIFEGE